MVFSLSRNSGAVSSNRECADEVEVDCVGVVVGDPPLHGYVGVCVVVLGWLVRLASVALVLINHVGHFIFFLELLHNFRNSFVCVSSQMRADGGVVAEFNAASPGQNNVFG